MPPHNLPTALAKAIPSPRSSSDPEGPPPPILKPPPKPPTSTIVTGRDVEEEEPVVHHVPRFENYSRVRASRAYSSESSSSDDDDDSDAAPDDYAMKGCRHDDTLNAMLEGDLSEFDTMLEHDLSEYELKASKSRKSPCSAAAYLRAV